MIHHVLASSRLFFNRDSVYKKNRRARQRAIWLYNAELAEAASTPEVKAKAELDLKVAKDRAGLLSAINDLEECIKAAKSRKELLQRAVRRDGLG
jgi:hypothetical protein